MALQPIERQLKRIFRRLVALAGGGKQAAAVVGVDESTISRYAAEHRDDMPTLMAVALLESDRQMPLVTQALADLTGYRLVAKDDFDCGGDLHQGFGELSRDFSRAMGTFIDALRDGKITPAERAAMARDIGVMQGHLMALQQRLAGGATAVVGGGSDGQRG